jgi:adenosine deaminase
MSWFDEVPKVELHVHLEGAIPHEGLFDLVQKYGGDPSVPDVAALAKRFEYKDFAQFIATWSWKNQFLRAYEDFSHVAELVARDFTRQGIRYAETFFSPSLFVRHRGLDVQKLTEAVRTGLSRATGVEVGLIADLVRDYGPKSEMTILNQLKDVRNLGVVGIGIGGSEHEYPPGPFAPLYAEARRIGFHTNAHAGEAAGAESMWAAIVDLQVERIGHGVRAREDPRLVQFLADHRIPLEMCPVSNLRTKAVRCVAEHPLRQYFQAGVPVTVNTDDPKMFQTSLAEEYRLLEQECGFTKAEICRLILTAIEASWLPEDRKTKLKSDFTRHAAWKGP